MNYGIEYRAGVEYAAGVEKADVEAQEKRMASLGCPADVLQRVREKRAARTAKPRGVRITPLPSASADAAADAARRKKAEELGRQILADDTKARVAEM